MNLSQQCFHATVSNDGVPNNAPRRSTRVFNDETLIFNKGVGGSTLKNIGDGSLDLVAVVNPKIMDVYRFVCAPCVITEGGFFEKSAEMSLKAGMPGAVILLHIGEIHSLKPGPMAGKKMD